MTQPIETYIADLQKSLSTGQATEHTHRPALVTLLNNIEVKHKINAQNEPKHRIDCGAPDVVVMKSRGNLVIGHIEAKDVGKSLKEVAKSKQLKRYRKYLPNLILTDYLDFHLYVNGDSWAQASLGTVDDNGRVRSTEKQQKDVLQLLDEFVSREPQPIANPRDLADRLARLTHMIRDIVVESFNKRKASVLLKSLRQDIARTLLPELENDENTAQFADLYAQTLTYGLFAACCQHEKNTKDKCFVLHEAVYEIPKTNPLLQSLFHSIIGPNFKDEPYFQFVEELVAILDLANIDKILENFGRATARQDPILHFYETFLATYDPEVRERRGVYYTPEPVVSYIVRSVDELLKSQFNIKDGLADTKKQASDDGEKTHRTLILDPACGTGTFLYEVVEQIREGFRTKGRAGLWNEYVHEHLLPRLYGFELLMAPYAMAHLKLGMQLAGQDMETKDRELFSYGTEHDERLQVYLTNTLEQVEKHMQHISGGLGAAIGEETKVAAKVKNELPILVVLGNPPYSGISSNNSPWIIGLLKGAIPIGDGNTEPTDSYYHIDGKPLGERNPKWLRDDYVKFIRWAQWRLEQTGKGILAFITNHSYLDNPTFRGMRWSLMQAFDEIYVLDLHGHTTRKEVAPDGSEDNNVFDIQKGVAIGIFVKHEIKKKQRKTAKVFHAELWGKRKDKYDWLDQHTIGETDWETLKPGEPFYLLKPLDRSEIGDYLKWNSISGIMPINTPGIVTGRDPFAIDLDYEILSRRIQDFSNSRESNASLHEKYLKEKDKLNLSMARKSIAGLDKYQDYIYNLSFRPFDNRYIFYHESVIERSRKNKMPHMIAGKNIALITARSNKFPEPNHFFASNYMVETKCGEASTQSCTFPLYIYPGIGKSSSDMFEAWPEGKDGRRPNLDPEFVKTIETATGLAFVSDGAGDLKKTLGPEDVLGYIYAVFHWPEYRRRYEPLLKLDFPRVPPLGAYGEDASERFVTFSRLGRQLLDIHLLEEHALDDAQLQYPIKGDDMVAKGYPVYVPAGTEMVKKGKVKLAGSGEDGRVYINREQYFEGVEAEVWEFQIGGYQVCEKWLKDRRGRKLSYDDMMHYEQIVAALRGTITLMAEIETAGEVD